MPPFWALDRATSPATPMAGADGVAPDLSQKATRRATADACPGPSTNSAPPVSC